MTTKWIPTLRAGPGTIADKIVTALQSDIDSGKLPTGMRLPSQRELAYALNLAVGTITRSYQIAENKGLVFSDGRRGTFVGSAPIDKSGLGELVRERDLVINLGDNLPTASVDPDLGRVLKVVARQSMHHELLRYGPYGSSKRHREAGAKWFKRLGLSVDSTAVHLTCGAQHALSVLFPIIAKPKEAIAAESVTYPGVKTLSDIHGFDLIGIEHDDEGMIPEALERTLKTRRIKAIYLMPTIQNPTGACMGLKRRKDLAELAISHDFLVIEDDIHRLLENRPPPLFAQMVPSKTCCVASVSKVLAGGLRVAFVVVPEHLRPKFDMAIQASMVSVPKLLFEIFTTWQDDGTADETLKARRDQARKRQQLAQKHLGEFRMSTQKSSPYVWLELPHDWPAHEFAVHALKAGVAVNSPDAFVVRPAPIPNRLRICLSCPDTLGQLDLGLKGLSALIAKRPHTVGPSM